MKSFIREYLWCFYLGFALTYFTDLTPLQWKWWAIGFPLIILVAIKDIKKEKP